MLFVMSWVLHENSPFTTPPKGKTDQNSKQHELVIVQCKLTFPKLGPSFGTTGHKVKTQGITPSSGQKRGDIEIINYL